MRFSIRDILLITSFVAIVALYWMSERNCQLAELRLQSQLAVNRRALLENAALISDPALYVANEVREAEVEELARQIELHFDEWQAKYLHLEPLDPQTVSLRQVPTLVDRKSGWERNRLQILIPDARQMYLKFVVATEPFTIGSVAADQFLTRSQFSDPGPCQCLLPSGLNSLEWSFGKSKNRWGVKVILNSELLLVTTLEVDGLARLPTSSIATDGQLDFGPGKLIPEIFRVAEPAIDSRSSSVSLHLWIEDASSGFRGFATHEKHDHDR